MGTGSDAIVRYNPAKMTSASHIQASDCTHIIEECYQTRLNIKRGSIQQPFFKKLSIKLFFIMSPPNSTDSTVESVSEQFQKLDLKKLAREQGKYQVYPKLSVSIHAKYKKK
jgi:hypothetical protein